MKHPLTSKERRGVVAIAAATLLCLAAGPLLRRCAPSGTQTTPAATDQATAATAGDATTATATADSAINKASEKKANEKDKGKKKRKKSGKKQKGGKVIPTRSPLDEACD